MPDPVAAAGPDGPGVRHFTVTMPADPSTPPAWLGGLGPFLARWAAQRGGWPPPAPSQVARVDADPDRTMSLAPRDALEAGAATADRLVNSGTDLVVVSGGGARTPTLVMLAALQDSDPVSVVGTIAVPGWAQLVADVRDGLRATRQHLEDPVAMLDAAGATEVAELAGLLLQCAVRRTPVLISGALDVCAAALVARRIAPGTTGWLLAACSPADRAAKRALGDLGLAPLLDLELDQPAAAELALGLLVGAIGLAASGAWAAGETAAGGWAAGGWAAGG